MNTLSDETLPGEIFVGLHYLSGEIFVTKRKIRHFRPTKISPKKVKVSLVEVQMNLRGKKVI